MSENTSHPASDIAHESPLLRLAPKGVKPYLKLMRIDRPIGTWLLLFPTWWGLALASDGPPDLWMATLFAIGAFLMRGAGCVMNDLADRDFDGQVARTAQRPIPAGDVSPKQAALFMGLLCLGGLAVLVQFNVFSVILGISSLALVAVYPFCKRWTYWPQAVLGLTFNWGALVGWAAVQGSLDLAAVLLYLAGVFWTLGYDTIYAHQDKADDAMVGIKSSALKLGDKTAAALCVFYGLAVALALLAGWQAGKGLAFYVIMAFAASHFAWQVMSLRIDDPQHCLKQFKANKWVGWIILIAIVTGSIA